MKHPFPHKLQYAMNLSKKSPEAVERINKWAAGHGGSVEHLSTETIYSEVSKELRRPAATEKE